MSEMTMVKRVVRGMRAAPYKPGEDMWEALARAAIAAMRTPSPNMLAEVTDMWQQRLRRKAAAGTIGQCHPHDTFTENWQCMIDAALRESPGEPQAHQRARQEQGGA